MAASDAYARGLATLHVWSACIIDLRTDPAFAWRCLEAGHFDLVYFRLSDTWACTPPTGQLEGYSRKDMADALYAAVEALGRDFYAR